MSDEEQEMKVIDRRRFIQVGETIEENPNVVEAKPAEAPSPQSAAPKPEPPPQAQAKPEPSPEPKAGTQSAAPRSETEQSRRESAQRRADQAAAGLPPADFVTLVEYLAQQVSLYMGEPDPTGKSYPANLPIAGLFIDLMGVLQEKTKGNITLEEAQLIDQLLYALRLQYVQKRR